MSGPCPTSDEWTRRVDGEVTANRADWLDRHASECAACRGAVESLRRLTGDIAAPLVDAPPPGSVERVMRNLDSAAPEPPRRRAAWWAAGGFAAAAAAAAIVFAVAARGGADGDRGEFTARGGGAGDRRVGATAGVTVYAGGGPIDPPVAVGARTRFGASYRNLADTPAYAMVFAVDAAGEVHWIYPAYLDPNTDPTSIELPPSRAEQRLPDQVELADPAAGPLRLITIVSPAPIHVSEIERSTDDLPARFPDADVREQTGIRMRR
jgi:hypothetical protein